MGVRGGDRRSSSLRLFFGVLLCWFAPNAMFAAFMQAARLRPPFDSVAALDPAILVYALLLGLSAAALLAGSFRALQDAEHAGMEEEILRVRLRRLFVSMPLFVLLYVLIGVGLMIGVVSDPTLWSGADLAVAATMALVFSIQILVPLGILCLDEFGAAFGHLVHDRPVLPGFLRSLPVLLLALMIGLMQPLHEYARFGEVSLAALVLAGLVLPYALAVTLLTLRYGSDALRSVFDFLAEATPERGLQPATLEPKSLDDYGVLIARTRDLVTRLEATRISLEESEARLRTFAEAASDWFFEADASLRFTWVSEQISRTLGVPAGEIVGLTFFDVAEHWPSDEWPALQAPIEAREPFRAVEVSLARRDDLPPLHLELSGAPVFGEDGEFRGYRGTGKDVTDVVEARRRLRERETQLAQAQKMEAVGQLTGGIAHDFNNLLTAVAGSLELLRLRQPELADGRLVEDALAASRRAGDLVQRLLAFSRRQALRPEVVDVGDKLEEMAELLRRTLGGGVELEVRVPDEPVRALVDPAQLESALLNLAINARDAMPSGGHLRLLAAGRRIEQAELELARGDYVSVRVEDTGTGIAADLLPHLFEPFFSTKPDGAGSGLGLSMVYGFVRQSGGDLRVKSEVGRGTRIELLLPRADADADLLPATGTHQALAMRRDATVLVVEDEPSVLAVVRETLQLVGCSVVHAETGAQALALLEAGPRVDLLLSDVVLPGELTGVDVVRRARACDPSLPCVLMSGYAREHLGSGAEDMREVPVLSKPFRLEDLLRTVTGELPG